MQERYAQRPRYRENRGDCLAVARSATNDSARDVRAADLQEELVKPHSRKERLCDTAGFTRSDEDGGDQRTSQRAERAIKHSARAQALSEALRERRRAPPTSCGAMSETRFPLAKSDERVGSPAPVRERSPNKWVKLRSSMS